MSLGVTPYGDGPDGGREAMCRSAINYHRAITANGNGYLVIQAKSKQYLPDDTDEAREWVRDQLRDELRKFIDTRRDLPKPDHCFLATDVRLTTAHPTGTKDKAFTVLADFAKELGFEDYDVWDYDKFRSLLDNAKGTRRRYAHFIAPGDVLSHMMDRLEGVRSDFDSVMAKYPTA